jgi:hypothetical protein
MKKDNPVSREELMALLERVKAQSLKEGDGQILKAIIEKTFALRDLYWGGKLPSKDELRRLLAIPRPERSND